MTAKKQPVEMSPGVLSRRQYELLLADGSITHPSFKDPPDVDASAFDLKLGESAWLLQEGQRPATRERATLTRQATRIDLERDERGDHYRLEHGKIYLIELDTFLDLPPNINGRATGKSSIGRLDVITRLLTDDGDEYDVVPPGYRGRLYLLVHPQTFSIITRPGDSLNQLRLFCGPPLSEVITHHTIQDFGTPFWYVVKQGTEGDLHSWEELVPDATRSRIADPALFDLTVDLADPAYDHAFKARRDADAPIDLRKGKDSHDPASFFEKADIELDGGARSLVLEQDSFYIMKSKERLFIPEDVAVEVIAISERIGDIRIHYAGFAHPGFGRGNTAGPKRGTPLIFEVRATDMPTRLYDGSLLAKMQLFRMSERAPTDPQKETGSGSDYDKQELKLSNIFHNGDSSEP